MIVGGSWRLIHSLPLLSVMTQVRNLSVFDPASISEPIAVVGVEINGKDVQKSIKQLTGFILRRVAIKSVITSPCDASKRLILLDPIKIPNKEAVESNTELLGGVITDYRLLDHTVTLGYKSFSGEEILAKLLPPNVTPVRSFEAIGHIAHLNLREPHFPYKELIGEVILAKNPGIRTVVTKTGKIHTKFRTFDMEVIAGEDNTVTTVGEGKVKFNLDFRKVYWNSRLGTEHTELATSFSCNETICDMFAGIGPFAIPAALKVGCVVHANDLNPESFHYLNKNKAINKIPDNQLFTYNLDGQEFVKELLEKKIHFHHVIMNLPASAYTFLPVFKGLFTNEYVNQVFPKPQRQVEAQTEGGKGKGGKGGKGGKSGKSGKREKISKPIAQKLTSAWPELPNNLPWIHCYGFSAAEDPKKDYLELVEKTLGCSLPDARVKEVRDVSPHKRMILASFPLPLSIALGTSKRQADHSPDDAPPAKKIVE